MALDANAGAPQREFGAVIPDGTFVHLVMNLVPGGKDMPPSGDAIQDQLDKGLFWPGSEDPNGRGLRAEMTVLDGEFARSKVFVNYMTVCGGSVDASGQSKGWLVTLSTIKAMINSALGLDPKDESPQAKANRVMRGFADLDGIEFWAKLGVETGGMRPGGGDYPDKNTLALVIEPDRPEYAQLKAGVVVLPQPRGTRSARGAAGGAAPVQAAADASKPAWQRAAAPAQAAGAAAAAAATVPAAAQAAPVAAAVAPVASGPKWLTQKTA